MSAFETLFPKIEHCIGGIRYAPFCKFHMAHHLDRCHVSANPAPSWVTLTLPGKVDILSLRGQLIAYRRAGSFFPVRSCSFRRPSAGCFSMKLAALVRKLEKMLGREAVLWRPNDVMLYEYDGLSSLRPPDVVVFPRNTADVVQIVKFAADHKLLVVPRGAGTGLSGGSLPWQGGILVAFARMKEIVEIDLENQRARVQPGVVNLDLSLAVSDAGYYFAPDPSSQKACTSLPCPCLLLLLCTRSSPYLLFPCESPVAGGHIPPKAQQPPHSYPTLCRF